MKKIKLFLFFSFLLISIVLSVVSCTKELETDSQLKASSIRENSSSSAGEENILVTYFYDGVIVVKGTFDPSLEESNTLILLKLDANQHKYVEIHGFSSEEKYLNFGDNNNFPLRLHREIENHLRDYAVSSGAITEYENTGIEPIWFTTYAQSYISSKRGNVADARQLAFMNDLCEEGGDNALFATTSATMYAGLWSDKVSSYYPINLVSGDSFFDKTFYRKHLATFINLGWTVYKFCNIPGLDNKTSSWIGF